VTSGSLMARFHVFSTSLKVLQRKIREMFLVILHVARETGAFLHQVIANDRRVLQRRGLAKRSVVSADNCHLRGSLSTSSRESTSCAARISPNRVLQTLFSLQVSPVVPLCVLPENRFSKYKSASTEKDSVPSLAPGPLINEKTSGYLC